MAEAKSLLMRGGSRAEALTCLETARGLKQETAPKPAAIRSAMGEYLYGWVLCRSTDRREEGATVLEYALGNFSWDAASMKRIAGELTRCRTQPVEAALDPEVGAQRTRWVIQAKHKTLEDWTERALLRAMSPLPVDWPGARSRATALSGTLNASMVASQPFLLIGTQPPGYLAALADSVLQPYYAYLRSQMGIQEAGAIYVFVAPDEERLTRVVESIYRVEGTGPSGLFATIAFSDPENRTAMAVCGKDPANCTSLAHELFHLLSTPTFEGAPWWLDEGGAELLESGDLRQGEFVARPGLRARKLDMASFREPELKRLLNFAKDDDALKGPPASSIWMARARFFCIYLHERGAFWDVYRDLRANPRPADRGGETILVERMGPLSKIAADFAQWAPRFVKRSGAAIP